MIELLSTEAEAILKYLESGEYGCYCVKDVVDDLVQTPNFVRLGFRELVKEGLVKRIVLPSDVVPKVFKKRLSRLIELGGGELGSGTGGWRVINKEDWFVLVSYWNKTMDLKLPEGNRGVVKVELCL